ncbi:hypothetical protein RD792_009852 [Penstemon davidsonii]|uniref:Prephenate dehydratase domain-containing protein n=1 Tax=Penstemon davidsonii TaxID=160366 RepID=A0ABR0D075_9LAMI|nr:hypothetical protein RD792_009852 [Penstemon davidsonii]
MHSFTPSGMDLKSLTRISSFPSVGLTHHRVGPARIVIQCVSRYDSTDVNTNSNPANVGSGHVGRARHDWQSTCAILASKVVSSEQQDTEKSNGGAEGISAVNGHPTLDLVPVNKQSSSPAPLPKPLSIADLSPSPMHGAQLRVAYQGVPGAYSEAAAGKAYPNCEAIPCDQFEVAFQAVELWIADRAVLPVENSLGGSIHRNYDLLLRHPPPHSRRSPAPRPPLPLSSPRRSKRVPHARHKPPPSTLPMRTHSNKNGPRRRT